MITAAAKRAACAITVAGIMSGTSGDGIDVAIVQIKPGEKGGEFPSMDFLGHTHFRFPRTLRSAVLSAMNSPRTSTAELARLHWRLGQAYAEALTEARRRIHKPIDLAGCHGQTIYHQPKKQLYCGRKVACTWQIGEAALIAASTGIPVVANFRPADMAAGGQGAPLVPLLDFVLYRHPHRGRVLQNLGGIANMTAIPPAANLSEVAAFDTGPANMVIDQLMRKLFQKDFDRAGATARRGKVLDSVVRSHLRRAFFRRQPPKSAGREQFGSDFADQFLEACRRAGGRPQDAIATATALTVQSIARAYASFVQSRMRTAEVDFIVSGGGARNQTLLEMLRDGLKLLRCRLAVSDEYGLPSEAKEAAAFALLAYQTWNLRPGNVPSATGAAYPAILGQIHLPSDHKHG